MSTTTHRENAGALQQGERFEHVRTGEGAYLIEVTGPTFKARDVTGLEVFEVQALETYSGRRGGLRLGLEFGPIELVPRWWLVTTADGGMYDVSARTALDAIERVHLYRETDEHPDGPAGGIATAEPIEIPRDCIGMGEGSVRHVGF